MTDTSTNNAPQSRQHQTSYPSPRSYPSPSMQPTYTYPPSSGQAASEPYRASPTGSNVSLPSLNLPPIRAIDGQSPAPPYPQQPLSQQSPPPGQQQNPSPLPPPVAPMSGYYSHQSPGMPNLGQPMGITSSPQQALGMRYPLPAPHRHDQRVMSGGRHKKEIKRRTKTGCLTCRKRRIKCDEAHPICRNCQKSKRECLGYDPIFKPQASPAQLQPAPSSASPTSTPSSGIPSAPSYPSAPQGYNQSSSSGYAQSPAQQQTGTASNSYDFVPAIDPALASEMQQSQQPLHDGTGGAGSARIAGLPLQPVGPRVRVDDLQSIHGITPPPPTQRTALPSEAIVDEVKLVYSRDYAPGLDKLLETQWYSQQSLPKLINEPHIFDLFVQMLDRFRHVKSEDFRGTQMTRSLEAKVVWTLLCMPRSPQAATNGVTGTPSQEEALQLVEVQKRLDSFEALITNSTLDHNTSNDIPYHTGWTGSKYWEVEFWRLLGQFVSRQPPPSGTDQVSISDDMTLASSRNLLAMLENRDVLYSIMVCRLIGSRIAEWPESVTEVFNNDQEDPRTKVYIAKKFLEDEASGKGTNQVIQRICDMAIRSWTIRR